MNGLKSATNLVKNPNFTISSWFWYSMTIIVKKNPLRFSMLATGITKFLDFFHGGIKLNLIPGL